MTIVTPDMIEPLSRGEYPLIERQLVQLAREGNLKGVNQKPARYSATTIQHHADCARLYYWPAVAGLESPGSPAQKFGTTLHAFQENYLKHGVIPPVTNAEGRLANLGLRILPTPATPGLYAERPFTLNLEGLPVPLTGTIDFGVDPVLGEGEISSYEAATAFRLGDHKTARSRRFPKTKEWLSKNIQSNLYAFVTWLRLLDEGFTGLKVVDKRWIYYFKDEKEVEQLRVVDSLDHVYQQFETVIKPNVLAMERMVREAPRISDIPLPKDKAVCDAYGGCPHRARCFGFGAKEVSMGILAGKYSKAAISDKAAVLGAGTAINPPKPRALPVVEEVDEAAIEAQNKVDAKTAVAQRIIEESAAAMNEVVAQALEEKPKRTRKPKDAEAKVAAVAAEVKEAFAPRETSLRTPGFNSAHDYWLLIGTRPTRGFDAKLVDIDSIVGTAQANATAATGREHFRQEFGGHAALEAAFAQWLEENPLVGAIHVPKEMSTSAKDVLGLLRAHAGVIFE